MSTDIHGNQVEIESNCQKRNKQFTYDEIVWPECQDNTVKGRGVSPQHYVPIMIIMESAMTSADEEVQKLEDTHIAGWKVKWLK